jgi:DNA repair protein SbcC/Rad50
LIIKKLKLENIRSYKSQIIDFPPGKTLFEGDIGSGKSTLLMAIEFGLFGLGSEKAASLLRAGETEGSVGLMFESDSREYLVTRRLVRKKSSIGQEDCILKTPEETKYYSATEIKERILEILNFNEPPDPKAQSVIYRYAIYTPQEEMKAILSYNADQRLQTLRKAFGIEDYKTAAENTKNLSNEIRIRSKELAAMALEIQSLKTKLDLLKSSIAQKKSELEILILDSKKMKDLIEDQKKRRDELRSRQLILKGETGKADALNALIAEKDREIRSAQVQLASNRSRIGDVRPKIIEMQELSDPSEFPAKDLKAQIQQLEGELVVLQEVETKVGVKFSDYKSILDKGVCPTCDTVIERDRFSDLVAHKDKELKGAHSRVTACDEQLQETRILRDRKIEFDQAQARLKDFAKSLSEYEENIRVWQSKLEEASSAREKANGELTAVRESVKKLQDVNAELGNLESRILESEAELKHMENASSSAQANISDWEGQREEYELSIAQKLEAKSRSDKLNEHQVWVQDYFLPTLELVEKHVMLNINQEFDSHFQRWFGMLVEDPGKQAKVDEEFTPVVQQDGIDQDISYLSGGEKTSIALAYRLALNAIVRRVSTGMKSNLLILDEPTDGFSKEQLSKVREILDELQSPQIILVSHERELESFADQVIRVSKANGESKVTVVE